MDFLENVIRFLSDRTYDVSHYPQCMLVFAAACWIVGSLVCLIDWGLSLSEERKLSVLGLRYNGWRGAFLVMFWGFSAAFFGFMGVYIHLFELSPHACAACGLSWPVILPILIEKRYYGEIEQRAYREE